MLSEGFIYSTLPHVESLEVPTPHTASSPREWFERAVGPHQIVDSKAGVELFINAHFDGARSNSNVSATSCMFVGDVDGVDDEKLLQIVENLTERGLAWGVASSFSHLGTKLKRGKEIPAGNCFRFVVHCDGLMPAEIKAYRETWARMNWLLFEGQLDAQTKDLARLYYQAAHPPESTEVAVWEWTDGDAFPLAELETVPRGELHFAEARERSSELIPVDAIELEGIFGKWSRKRSAPFMQKIGEAGLALLQGRPFAEEGERHNTLRSLTKLVVAEVPNCAMWDAENLADHFEDSFRVSGYEDEGPMDIINLFEGAVEKFRDEAMDMVSQEELAIRRHIAAVYEDRDTPITPAEEQAFMKARGLNDPSAIKENLIVEAGKTLYISTVDGGVLPVPVSKGTVAGDGMRKLSVFFPNINPTGEHKGDTVVRDHGQAVDQIVHDYNATSHSFDSSHHILTVKAAQRRYNGPAKAHPECMRYIDLMDGEGTVLKDYLSGLFKLDKPMAALVAVGKKGMGKSLLPITMAEMFHAAPVPIDEATGDFPWRLTQCPVVFGDETMGQRYAKSGSEYIRREISHGIHSINRKYRDQAELRGYLRFWFALNDLELVSTNEALNSDSITAFCERLVPLRVPEAAGAYLRELGGRDYIETHWKGQGTRLYETIMWLNENWESKNQGDRFYLEGSQDSEIGLLLRSSQGFRQDVLTWIYRFLDWARSGKAKGKDVFGHSEGLVLIEDGQVFLTGEAVHSSWQDVFKTNPPSARMLEKAVAGLAEEKARRKTPDGRYRRFAVILEDVLLERANTLTSLGEEGVLEALKRGSLRILNKPTQYEPEQEKEAHG